MHEAMLKTLLRQKNCVSEGHTLKQMSAPLRSTQYNPSVRSNKQCLYMHEAMLKNLLRHKNCVSEGHTLKQMNAPLRSTQYNPSVLNYQTGPVAAISSGMHANSGHDLHAQKSETKHGRPDN